MVSWMQRHWLIAVGIGLIGGIVLGGYWPHTPLYAVATDRVDTFAMATGFLDTDVEAVYLLDFLRGDLRAIVLGKTPGTFSGLFVRNIAQDLGVDPQKNPKFMMVTGMIGLRRAGGNRTPASSAVCYVAEISSGKLAGYAVPWSASLFSSGQTQSGELLLVGETMFRKPIGTGPAAGGGPAATK
jgi:hypothetical protein